MCVRWGMATATALLIASVAFGQEPPTSPGGGQQPGGQPPGGQQPMGAPGLQPAMPMPRDDKGAIKKMLMANMAEVELGQMAATRAVNPEVKSFAQMMVDQHTQANKELLPIAQQKGISQPTELDGKHKKMLDRLSKLQGAEFDRQFMKTMVDAHKDAVNNLKPILAAPSRPDAGDATGRVGTSGTGSTGGTTGTAGSTASSTGGQQSAGATAGTAGSGSAPQTIDEYAAKTAPVVQQHLQQAQQLERQLGK
jgi:putative membrane protein